MFLAAALLIFSIPQSAQPNATELSGSTAVAAPVVVAEDAKSDSSNLPSAPTPKIAADNSALSAAESSSLSAEPIQPGTPIQPLKPPKAAIRGVRYETPRQKIEWIGLSIAGHGTAAFDAYSTRQALSGGYGTESNPLLRPFAHSGAIYAATQVSPTVMDFLGHKMMKSRSPLVRKMWWVPQAAGASFSFAAGMHNMSLVK